MGGPSSTQESSSSTQEDILFQVRQGLCDGRRSQYPPSSGCFLLLPFTFHQPNPTLTAISSIPLSKTSPAPIVERNLLVLEASSIISNRSNVPRQRVLIFKSVSPRRRSITTTMTMSPIAQNTETPPVISASRPSISPHLNNPVSIFTLVFFCLYCLVCLGLIVEAPRLQATRPPQSPLSTYSTHATSDTDLQSNYLATESVLDETQLDVESRPAAFFDHEDLMSFGEPTDDLTKKAQAPNSQRNTPSAQPAQDDVNFPALDSLSLSTNAPTNNKWANNAWVKPNLKPAAPPVQNAWTNKPAPLSSTANVNNTKPVTPAVLNAWSTKQPANPKAPAERASLPLANMNASAQASTKEKTEWHPLDPKNPRFNVSIFYCSYLDKYKCPHALCS